MKYLQTYSANYKFYINGETIQPGNSYVPISLGVSGEKGLIKYIFNTLYGIFSSIHLYLQCGRRGPSYKTRSQKMKDQVTEIDLWSGNRTSHRRDYEREVLLEALHATRQEYGDWKLVEHTRDYPGELESGAFREYGHDLFVTTAGNRKMSDENKNVVYQPIQNDLLGYRVLIIREEDKARFARINREEALKAQKVGIPDSWADAELLRYNGFKVVERGSFDDMFARLLNHEFDFTALGINEIDRVFAERADEVKHIATIDHLMIYYPLPLLFYVNPDLPELAIRIEKGMKKISKDNTMDRLFFNHNREILENMDLSRRKIVRLKNPNLPREIAKFESELNN